MSASPSQALVEWESAIQATLAEGHCFRAYDQCKAALQEYPGVLRLRLLAALASLRSGDVTDAKAVVAPLADELESTESRVRRLMTLLASGKDGQSTNADEVQALLSRLATPTVTVDAMAAELMTDICREVWWRGQDPDDLRRANDMASRAFALEPSGRHAFTAAVLAELCGQHENALHFAEQAVTLTHTIASDKEGFRELPNRGLLTLLRGGQAGKARSSFARSGTLSRIQSTASKDNAASRRAVFYEWASRGLLALLQGNLEAATAAFDNAGTLSRRQFGLRMPLRRDLSELVAAGLHIPSSVESALPPPTVVLFSGVRVDRPGAKLCFFPPELEAPMAAEIFRQLEDMNAEIGYSSAAPGADLLFVEAMIEHDAEVNIVLPCAVDDFIEQRVRPAGRRWEKRFRNALKLAKSVTLTTTDPLIDDLVVLQHNNRVIDGTARLRARTLGFTPYLLAVWDHRLPSTPGSVSDFIDHWGDPARLKYIRLDDLRSVAGIALEPALAKEPYRQHPSSDFPRRRVRAMLFADIVGYSKLDEADLPAFWAYMEALAEGLSESAPVPELIESWGDALYVVHETAQQMAEYADALVRTFADLDSRTFGLPNQLSVRIGLHAGPVFVGTHPLTGRAIVYGGQVNRAARIEPICRPGHIYASEQFVATLVAEENLAVDGRRESVQHGYSFEYLGTLELAKNFGRQAVYQMTNSRLRADGIVGSEMSVSEGG